MPHSSVRWLTLRATFVLLIAITTSAAAAGGVQQITLEWSHACAVVSGGKLVCWGKNDFGQIGTDETGADDRGPVQIFARDVTAVASGFRSSCAVVRRALICWGDNIKGRFGNGTSGDILRPTPIIGEGVSAVAMGAGQTCAVISRALWCWGANTYGQIGNGEAGDTVAVPTRIIAADVTAVSAGDQHTCAIVNGGLWCWGLNDVGQIGTGIVGGYGAKVLRPAQVIAGGVTAVSVGYVNTCAVVRGSLQCWGNNERGQVGTGEVGGNVPKPTPVISGGVAAVSIGRVHACAVVKGRLQCWGENKSGALGRRVAGDIISEPRQEIASGVTQVWTGGDRTCAQVNGAVRCRGDDTSIKPFCYLAVSVTRCIGSGVSRIFKTLEDFRPFDSRDGDLDENDFLRTSCVGELPAFALGVIEGLQIDPPAFATCKVWPADRSKTIVVLAHINAGDLRAASETSGDLDVLIVNTDDRKVFYRLHQTGALTNSLTGISIDTANYAVTGSERAFGVRASYEDSGLEYGGRRTVETLNLYLPMATDLKEILQNLILHDVQSVEYRRVGDEAVDGMLCASETLLTRVVAKAATTSHGYFDLVLKEKKIARERSLVKESCDAVTDTLAPSRQYLLHFDGNSYALPEQHLQYSVPPKAPQ